MLNFGVCFFGLFLGGLVSWGATQSHQQLSFCDSFLSVFWADESESLCFCLFLPDCRPTVVVLFFEHLYKRIPSLPVFDYNMLVSLEAIGHFGHGHRSWNAGRDEPSSV